MAGWDSPHRNRRRCRRRPTSFRLLGHPSHRHRSSLTLANMKALFPRIGAWLRTRDTLSWFLVIAGIVVVATLAESAKLHHEVGPHGGHHGDVAGGLSLLGFFLLMAPLLLAFAGVAALLAKSTSPLVGTVLGLVASVPMVPVLCVFSVLLRYISPPVAIPFPFVVGIALVIVGFIRKPKKSTGEQQSPRTGHQGRDAQGGMG